MFPSEKIFVAGHRGLVGSAIVRNLSARGYGNLILRSHQELDLTNQAAVDAFFAQSGIDYVIVAAGKVGGILANHRFPADFLFLNLMIAANVIHSSAKYGVKKLLYLGSSCVFPRLSPQPIREEYLLTGALEPTNEAYAIAKISGLKLCEYYSKQYGKRFISAMPTNLYGINDNLTEEQAHVIPGMMQRFHLAKLRGDAEVMVWGTGSPRREFLYVDDLADALFHLMESYEDCRTVNVGSGEDCSIAELAQLVKETVSFQGEIRFDTSRPDGMPRKLLDVTRVRALHWTPKVSLRDGLQRMYAWAIKSGALPESLPFNRDFGIPSLVQRHASRATG